MKTAAAVLSTLALAASSAQAALTPHNTTYDFLTVSVYEAYGSVTGIILNKTDNDWLLDTYVTLFAEVETELEAAQQPYPYYAERLATFFDDAAAYDAQYETLSEEYAASDLPLELFLTFAAAPYFDVVFDIVETFLPTLKNKTLSDWHTAQRKALEKSVEDEADVDVLAEQIVEYLTVLFEDEAAATSFDETSQDLADKAAKEYEIWFEDDERDETQ